MRVIYVPCNERAWAQYYNSQALQHGGGFYAALPYQRGAGLGSLFRGIFRAILPVAKSVGKTVGRQALQTGSEIASDVLSGKSLKDAAEERGKAGASVLLKKAARKLSRQKGRGLGIRSTKKQNTRPAPKSIKRNKKKTKDQLGFYYQ